MAKKTEIQQLILQEIQEVKAELKQVRQNDIPNLKVDMAVVKAESKQSARIISGIGGLIAVGTSIAVAFLK